MGKSLVQVMTDSQPETPIIINRGKVKRKSVKDLKKGKGKLMKEITQAMAEVKQSLAGEIDGKMLVPIVVVYKKKSKRKKKGGLSLPFLMG